MFFLSKRLVISICLVCLVACRTSDHDAKSSKQVKSPLLVPWENGHGFTGQDTPEYPLHTAVLNGDEVAIAKYLASGMPIDANNQYGVTPLQVATALGKLGTVKMLLERGAGPNEVTHGKQTALHFCALNGYVSIAELLIDNGASINPLDLKNWTPLDCALLRGEGITFKNIDGRKAVAELLVNKGGRKGKEITSGHK